MTKDAIIRRSGRAKSHQRYIDPSGEQQPGGSTIGNLVQFSGADGLIFWGIKLYKEGQDFKQFREESAQFGSCAHKAVESLFKGERFDEENWPQVYTGPAKIMAENFFKTLDNLGLEMLGSEVSLPPPASHPEDMGALLGKWGGQLDLVLGNKGTGKPTVLGDLKTSSSVNAGHVLQVAGCYSPVFEALYGDRPERVVLFRMDRNPPHSCFPHEIDQEKREAAEQTAVFARQIWGLKPSLTRGLRN